MDVVVLRETVPGERRVAAVPDTVRALVGQGFRLHVEERAGEAAWITDSAYAEAGARLLPSPLDPDSLRASLESSPLPPVFLKVRPPRTRRDEGHESDELTLLPRGALLISLLESRESPGLEEALAAGGVSMLALERMPRTTRAQSMDALSSQATVAGYRAVTLGAGLLGRFLPMLTTAAGTIPPARVLVLGAGVAGLQAVATARRLGAIVHAFDIRPAVKEQVESLGARFLEAELAEDAEAAGGYARELAEDEHERNRRLISDALPETDLLVTSALVPGRRAPLLVTDEMVERMAPGGVIVDLAAESGGNCSLTRAGSTLEHGGVTIAGPTDVASDLPVDASRMYARNVASLLRHVTSLVPEDAAGESWPLDLSDDILSAICVTHEGRRRLDGSSDRPEIDDQGDRPATAATGRTGEDPTEEEGEDG